jgi:hypothetical protein
MLDSAFDHMIDAQIAASAQESNYTRTKRVPQQPSQGIPDTLTDDNVRIVVVYCEASPLRAGDAQARTPIRLSAAPLDGQSVFDRMVQNRNARSAYQAAHLEVPLHDFDTAQPLDEVLDAFRAFCEESSEGTTLVLVSWGVWTHRWLEEAFTEVPCVMLKGVWANVSRSRVPDLDTVVSELGLSTPELSIQGRAGRRLSHACAMTRHILSGVTCAS